MSTCRNGSRFFLRSSVQLTGLHRIILALELQDLPLQTQMTGHLTCCWYVIEQCRNCLFFVNMNLSSHFVECRSVWTNHRGNGQLISRVADIYCVFTVKGMDGYQCGRNFWLWRDVQLQLLWHKICLCRRKEAKTGKKRKRKSITDWKPYHPTEKVRPVYKYRG